MAKTIVEIMKMNRMTVHHLNATQENFSARLKVLSRQRAFNVSHFYFAYVYINFNFSNQSQLNKFAIK